MKRLCILVTRMPSSSDGQERVFGGIRKASEAGLSVSVYLVGDGVLLAKQGPMGQNMGTALNNGIDVLASAKDLRARAITSLVDGVEAVEEFEDALLDEVMERSDKVITW